jgi:hypothetical protein
LLSLILSLLKSSIVLLSHVFPLLYSRVILLYSIFPLPWPVVFPVLLVFLLVPSPFLIIIINTVLKIPPRLRVLEIVTVWVMPNR